MGALRQIYRKVYQNYHKHVSIPYRTMNVNISKLLRGGENGIRVAKYAQLTNHFLRPSTLIVEGPHVKLLRLYDEIGEEVLKEEVFVTTDYYKNAFECMTLTGAYFYDRPDKIKQLAERFIRQYKGETLDLSRQPGQSDTEQPIWIRPIKFSSCFEVIDGNHRIALAIMRGETTIPALIYEKEPVLTPLQQLLLDCLWINKQKWLYQPIDAPELKDQWHLIRQCTDRLEMMKKFLQQENYLKNDQEQSTYIDIGSSYGWFVKQMSILGFDSYGMERDPFGMEIGFKVYGVDKQKIIHSDICIGLEKKVQDNKKYDIVSCLSVLHHFVLGKSSTSAEEFIQLLDKITGRVLFLDTGEEHEAAFNGMLQGWNVKHIIEWLKKNTSFKTVVSLGIDQDRRKPFDSYYARTLFVCVR